MSNIGTGEVIYEFRKKIQNMKSELDELISPIQDMPQLIISANLLRSNEHLAKVIKKQTELLSVYANYSESLEEMIATLFDIQNGLKNLLREQSALMTDTQTSGMSSTVKSKRKPDKVKKLTKK